VDILGVSAFRGPGAACLLRDGRIVAAAREDRFTRRAGDEEFPSESIAYCLRAGKLGPTDVSGVAFAGTPELPYSDSREGSTLKERLGRWLGRRPGVADLVAADLDKLTPLRFVDPERAHAAGAYFTSPLPDAAVLVVRETRPGASLWRGRGASLERLRDVELPREGIAEFVRSLADETDADALALGGPAAARRDFVEAVRRGSVFPDFWIHPAAGGGADAIGAALDVWLRSGAPGSEEAPRLEQPGAAPGPGYNVHQIRTFLRSRQAVSTEVERGELADRAADLLADGVRLGWFAGRLDLAEDTTPTRSVLRRPTAASPMTAEESLAVPSDRAGEIVEIAPGDAGAFLVAAIREPWRERLGEEAGSSRLCAVSIVDRDAHRELYGVLAALERRDEPPVVAARALARPGEPPACTPDDAYEAWTDLRLEALLLGPYLLQRAERRVREHAGADSP